MNSRTPFFISLLILRAIFLSSCGGRFQFRPDVALGVLDRNRELKYFTQYTETDEIIDVEEGSINPGYSYRGDSFVYGGNTYVLVKPKAVYEDGHRQEAVANLDDGKNRMTVYKYDYPASLHILNVSDFLYCRDDELDDYFDYYNDPGQCEFTYQFIYMVPDRSDRIVVEKFEDLVFDDKTFLDLSNGNPNVCKEVKRVIRVSKHVRIRQNTVDTYFVRDTEFYRTDGQVYMVIFNHMAGDGSDMDVHKCYLITDPDLVSFINRKMDECNRVLMEEYDHPEEEY